MLSNPYEEAKAIANLGRLALQLKDYPQARVMLQQALAALKRLGAMYDALVLYEDLRRLFLAQGDHARAEEMAVLREREAGRLGYMDVTKDLTDAAECAENASGKGEARQDYAGHLQLFG
jgi:tetratricopeptide (TPR) repeat protein